MCSVSQRSPFNPIALLTRTHNPGTHRDFDYVAACDSLLSSGDVEDHAAARMGPAFVCCEERDTYSKYVPHR